MASSTDISAFEFSDESRPVIAFTNGVGEPKKIDVNRCLNELGNTADLATGFPDQRDRNDFIYACPRTPLAPITFEFGYEPNVYSGGFVNTKGIQFAYQSVYKDGSVSSLSPWSDLAVPPSILALGTASIGSKNIENVCS